MIRSSRIKSPPRPWRPRRLWSTARRPSDARRAHAAGSRGAGLDETARADDRPIDRRRPTDHERPDDRATDRLSCSCRWLDGGRPTVALGDGRPIGGDRPSAESGRHGPVATAVVPAAGEQSPRRIARIAENSRGWERRKARAVTPTDRCDRTGNATDRLIRTPTKPA